VTTRCRCRLSELCSHTRRAPRPCTVCCTLTSSACNECSLAAISQTTTHMHGHHEATMAFGWGELGARAQSSIALSHTASVRRSTVHRLRTLSLTRTDSRLRPHSPNGRRHQGHRQPLLEEHVCRAVPAWTCTPCRPRVARSARCLVGCSRTEVERAALCFRRFSGAAAGCVCTMQFRGSASEAVSEASGPRVSACIRAPGPARYFNRIHTAYAYPVNVLNIHPL